MTLYVPRVRARKKYQIENDATEVLSRHFPERLREPGKLDVLELWELLEDFYGLKPGVDDLSDGIEGMTWPDGRVFVSEETYRSAVRGQGRARFTMCHEAYHGIWHRSEIHKVLVDTGELALYRRGSLPCNVDPEWQANAFAAAILMPAKMVKEVLREAGNQEITDMMYFFGVSRTAARYRIESVRRQS